MKTTIMLALLIVITIAVTMGYPSWTKFNQNVLQHEVNVQQQVVKHAVNIS